MRDLAGEIVADLRASGVTAAPTRTRSSSDPGARHHFAAFGVPNDEREHELLVALAVGTQLHRGLLRDAVELDECGLRSARDGEHRVGLFVPMSSSPRHSSRPVNEKPESSSDWPSGRRIRRFA